MPTSSNKSLLELEVEMSGWKEAEAAASSLDSVLSDLEGGVTIEVDLDAPDVSVLEDLSDTEITPTLEVEESEETKGILDGVNFLVALEKIKLAIEIVGTIWEFMGSVEQQFVEPFLDVEDAVARINAQTGTTIPDLDQLIRDLQAADLGDSVDQIADVVIHAQQIGAPMREAAEAALTFTHTFDENPETVLDSLNTLVTTHLVPNLQEAADLMTVFFQQGGNVGGDALAVVNSNAQSWADMSLTAAEALSTIDSLQQGTGATATEAAKMLQTFDDAMTAAAADPASEQANTLRLMGITNPKDAGEAIGAETIDGFAAAFDDLAPDQQDLISGLFFGKGGKKFTGAIEGMTTQNGIFADVVGAAEAAATEIDNSLRGAIDDFVLEINTSIARLLSSDELDLPGKIADLKEAFQAAATTLAEGGSIGDALSVGFHIEGVDTALLNIERIFGNMLIGLLQVVSLVQAVQGVDNTGTKTEIARLSQAQLAFDLKVANPEEVEALVTTALGRGVDNAGIGAAFRVSIEEAFNEGDFGQSVNIMDAAVEQMIANGASPETIAAFTDQFTTQLQTAFDSSIETGDFDVAKKIADAQNDPTAYTDAIKGKFGFDAAAFDSMAADFATGMETSIAKESWWDNLTPPPEAITAFDGVKTAVTTLGTDVDTAMTNASLVTGLASQEMINALSDMSDGVVTADEEIAMAITGNTMTASFDAMSMSALANAEATKGAFQGVLATVSSVDARMSAFFNGIMAKVAAANAAIDGIGTVPTGGGGGNTTNNNIVVTNNTSTQSPAQADGLGYRFAAQIRGFG